MTGAVKYPCEATLSAAPVAVPRPAPESRKWILAATILGSAIVFIDGTVVNVALPNLQASFHATLSQVQWVVESYALFLASLLLVGGALGDRYGRRFIFSLGVLIFGATSALCGFCSNIHQLILARAVQGIGGALLVPGSLAIISASFPPEERGKAIGTWSAFTGITAAIGPVLGGWLVQHLSWRWVFFINVPIAIAVLVLSYWRVPESRAPEIARKLDLLGAALITFGLGTLTFGLIESQNRGWRDSLVIATIMAGSLAIAAFIVVEARQRNPLMPLYLFRIRDFAGANLLTLFLYAALGILLFFLPFDLIQVHGYTPTQAGAANLPFILIVFFLSRWAGGLVTRYGPRLPLVVGSLLSAIGFTLFALPGTGGSYWTTFFPAMIVLGLGLACVVAPLTTVVMNSVETSKAGIASGINNSISRIASLLAIAVGGVIVFQLFHAQLRLSLDRTDIPQTAKLEIYEHSNQLAQIHLPDTLKPKQEEETMRAIKESFAWALRQIMLLAAALAMISALFAWKMIDPGAEKPTEFA
ncbi:MAG TPA: MFS transporter [Candidatus Angelobacter sp.]